MQKESVLGVGVTISNYDELMDSIEKDIGENVQKEIIAINPEKLVKAKNDAYVKQMLNSAEYAIPDGIGIIIASKLKKGAIVSRVTGIGAMEKVCSLANNKGYKIFMYGAREEILLKAKHALEERYEKINIVGYQHGYEKDTNKIIESINESEAQILFVALGSPRQEMFITENKDKLCVNILQGVGGSFDIIGDNVSRAPKWMQNLGLEWLFRLLKEPSRAGRQLDLFRFIGLVLIERRST